MANKEIKFKLHQYMEHKSERIYQDIANRTIIYLDMNYWIYLRDGASNEESRYREFYSLVDNLHQTGKFIFPISEIIFWEILKQTDIQTRKATLQLVDRFSEGIAISNSEHRILMETSCWMNEAIGKPKQPVKSFIWSKINTVMNYQFCQTIPDGFREEYLDFAAGFSLEQIIADKPGHFSFKDDVIALNTAIKAHAGENKSPQEMFLSEIGGLIAEHAEKINEANEYEYFKLTGIVPGVVNYDEKTPTFDKIMYYGFKNNKITDQIPSLQIFASLHAWTRWIKKDFKDGNDTMDFMHATVALPYADYFFTEKRLTAGITEQKLDHLYNCRVEWKYSDVLECLRTITQPVTE